MAEAVWGAAIQACGWQPEHDAESVARSYLDAARVPKKAWGGVHLYAHWTVGRLRGGVAYVAELVEKQPDAAAIGVAGEPDERGRVRQSGRRKPSGK